MIFLVQGRSISGALKYAVDQINNCTGVLPDVELDFIYNDTQVIMGLVPWTKYL